MPDYFDPPRLHPQPPHLPPFRSWWTHLPSWISSFFTFLRRTVYNAAAGIAKVGLDLTWTRKAFKETLMWNWRGSDYGQSPLWCLITHHTKLILQDRSSLVFELYLPVIRNLCLNDRSQRKGTRRYTPASSIILISPSITSGNPPRHGVKRSGRKAVTRV